MQTWTLIFAALAAITGAAVARWEWLDRPQHAWEIDAQRQVFREDRIGDTVTTRRIGPDEPHKVRVAIRPVGTATAYVVQARLVGSFPHESGDMFHGRMSPGDGTSISFETILPDASEGSPFVEVRWRHPHRRRQMAERIDLRTLERTFWRWHWRTLRPARWGLRRTNGGWHDHPSMVRRAPIPLIPE